jgi:microcystin-dependent protein
MDPFIGEVKLFAGNYAPVGWAFCDGSLLSIAENDELFSLIGTTYGGDGSTTFGLPDLRGRVPVNQGSGPRLSPYSMGQAGGSEQVTLTGTQIPPHTHGFVVNTAAGTAASPANAVLAAAPSGSNLYRETPGTVAMTAGIVGTVGGTAHENRQPYQAINYIIAIAGIYPPPQ